MKLQDEQSLFEAIEICEEQFKYWLINKLKMKGIDVKESMTFYEMLNLYEGVLNGDRQHVNPLLKWIEEKKKCSYIKKTFDSNRKLDFSELEMLEKTAMDGAVLLMTFRNN